MCTKNAPIKNVPHPQTRVRVNQCVLIAFLLSALVLYSPKIVSLVLSNGGLFLLRNSISETQEQTREAYPIWRTTAGGQTEAEAFRQGSEILQQAVVLDSENDAARWGLGRAALWQGDSAAACRALTPLRLEGSRNPLLYLDLLLAYDKAGMPAQTVALYERYGRSIQLTRPLSDTVALAYLDQARTDTDLDARVLIERAVALRPFDLYANFRLWQEAVAEGDLHTSSILSKTLNLFPLEALSFTDLKLLGYTTETVPELLRVGLWDKNTALNVVAFLVWQHHDSEDVAQLLMGLTGDYPADVDWQLYLGELYQRRGALQQAEDTYVQALALDPACAQAHLQLGMIALTRSAVLQPLSPESSQASLRQAADWLEQYRALVPGDLLGLNSLVQVYQALGRSELELLQTRLTTETDDQLIVAELLSVSTQNVDLGPNLVENGGFEDWSNNQPAAWMWSTMFNEEPFGSAAFISGPEEWLPFRGQRSARIDGLWTFPQEGRSTARAGFWQSETATQAPRPITLTARGPYVFSFYYRTVRVQGSGATTWVSYAPEVLWGNDRGLPNTAGAWYHFVAVGWNLSGTVVPVRPLVRSFAPGTVLFDEIELRPIVLSGSQRPDTTETRFWVSGSDS